MRRRHPVPFAGFDAELLAALRCEAIELGAPVVLRSPIFGDDPASLQQAMQRGIERSLLDLQHIGRGRSIALAIACPCAGPGCSVRRISRSSVPCSSSMRSSLVDILGEATRRSPRMSRGRVAERPQAIRSLRSSRTTFARRRSSAHSSTIVALVGRLLAVGDVAEHQQPRRLEQAVGAERLLDERLAVAELLQILEQRVGKPGDVEHARRSDNCRRVTIASSRPFMPGIIRSVTSRSTPG